MRLTTTAGFKAFIVQYHKDRRAWVTTREAFPIEYSSGEITLRSCERLVYARSAAKAATTASDLLRKGKPTFQAPENLVDVPVIFQRILAVAKNEAPKARRRRVPSIAQ